MSHAVQPQIMLTGKYALSAPCHERNASCIVTLACQVIAKSRFKAGLTTSKHLGVAMISLPIGPAPAIYAQKGQRHSHSLRLSCLHDYQHGWNLHAGFRSTVPPALTSVYHPAVAKRRNTLWVHASSAGAAHLASSDDAPESESPVAKFKALFSPFSEAGTNKKLLALCGAQALSSVATLIHDTYLPLYLSEELKLSNTKVRH